MTITGLANYMQLIHDDIFAEMILPDGIERDVLIDNIVVRCADFETEYSDPRFVQKLIGVWSKKWYRTFDKWVKALALEYDPISNYDREETWTDTATGNSTSNSSGNSVSKKSAYNSASLENDSAMDTTGNVSSNNANNMTHSGRVKGNIGVTTSQQMLESELNLAQWNLYEHITDMFVREFCIPIY